MKFLPIGSVVKLKDENLLLMIDAILPLYEEDGVTGYYDYRAIEYPLGSNAEDDDLYCFNFEDIEEVVFKGYVSPQSDEVNQNAQEWIKETKYPKLSN